MLKLISKFVLNVFPSVAASVIGGYIVHNYIYARPAAPASTLASKADTVAIDDAPFAMPIPVVDKAVATETPAASRQRPEAVAISSRNLDEPKRTVGERLNVVHRGGHVGMAASQRERVSTRVAAAPPAAAAVTPAINLVPEAQDVEMPARPRIDAAAASARTGLDRLIPPMAEMPLIKRLSALSTDVETMLVSQTQSAADGVATTAKSVLHAVLPR